MKYKYHFRFLDDMPDYLIIDLPESIQVVSSFLELDVQGGGTEFYTDIIDRVLSGETEYHKITGNSCMLDIRKTETVVTNFHEDESCVIETDELRELILIWVVENAKNKL